MDRMRDGIVAEKSAVCRRLGRRVEDRVEVLREAHVQHFVRFVENEHAQVGELQRPAPDVIERAAGRGDDDAGAALERADLLVEIAAPP